jgi:DNA-binding MarR family transcriptional regulator
VYITSAGEHAMLQVREIASRFYNIAFHDLSADEIEMLNALLRRVFSNLALRP